MMIDPTGDIQDPVAGTNVTFTSSAALAADSNSIIGSVAPVIVTGQPIDRFAVSGALHAALLGHTAFG